MSLWLAQVGLSSGCASGGAGLCFDLHIRLATERAAEAGLALASRSQVKVASRVTVSGKEDVVEAGSVWLRREMTCGDAALLIGCLPPNWALAKPAPHAPTEQGSRVVNVCGA
jgi:hypothetical protein